MAYKTQSSISALLLMALILTMLNLDTMAQPTPPSSPLNRGLRATGQLCCSGDGNCGHGTRPIRGATVGINCTRGSDLGGQNTTNANGNFVITSIESQALSPGQHTRRCYVSVQLPPTRPNMCRELASSNNKGILFATLGNLGSVRLNQTVS